MDERIETKAPPVYVATTSPAHIPGITAPSAGPAEQDGDAAGGTPDAAAPPEDAAPEATAAAAPEARAAADAEQEAADPEEADTDASATAAPADGPVFEAADRRASVTADADGIRLRLDDQEAEFTWSEVAAVESSVSRFGRRLLVAVHTPGPWRYPAEVEADGKETAKEWLTALDAVLDAYFEE
ncbi:hypothetical protein [Streptomyces sp. NPDC058374]|uniref:hypothetical protein n=1 Tax=unclassified Streptomyces TaxID=2593676 RepID=UPI00365C7BF5